MRAFLAACLMSIVVAVGGYFFVNTAQQASGLAYATDGARISPSWAWRSTGANEPATPAEECDTRKSWQWIFVDFGTPHGEPAACRISQ